MIFVFEFVYMVDYIDGFPYVKPSLHARDEAYLITVNDRFDEFCMMSLQALLLAFKVFVEKSGVILIGLALYVK